MSGAYTLMSIKTESDWPLALKIVQDWLAANKRKPIWLAEQSGISRSIISRFIHGRSLDDSTALRLYAAVHPGMNLDQKLQLLGALGLLSLVLDIRKSLETLPDAETTDSLSDTQNGEANPLAQVRHIAERSWIKGLSLYHQIERTFGPHSINSSRAAIQATQMLINLGDFEQAERERARVASMYEGLFTEQDKIDFSWSAGWIQFGKRDMDAALTDFMNTLHLAEAYGRHDHVAAVQHFVGMVYTRKGKRARTHDQAAYYFAQAEDYLKQAYVYTLKRSGAAETGFNLFRLGQLYAAMGRAPEAAEMRRKATDIFHDDAIAKCHLSIEVADLQLRDGNTQLPGHPAETSMALYANIGYAQGLARTARTLMVAGLQNGRTKAALVNGIAAVLFNPYVTLDDSTMLKDYVSEVNTQLRGELHVAQHSTLLHHIHDDVIDRRGVFAHLGAVAANRDNVIAALFSDLGLHAPSGS